MRKKTILPRHPRIKMKLPMRMIPKKRTTTRRILLHPRLTEKTS